MKVLRAAAAFGWLLVSGLATGGSAAQAENSVTAAQFVVEPATLINLGFEWAISGDANRNATVEVTYRKAGDTAWSEALPLLRMGGERIFRAPYTVPDRFAGSVLDLTPDTSYEVRLTMKDPDGVRGQAVQTPTIRTRRWRTCSPRSMPKEVR